MDLVDRHQLVADGRPRRRIRLVHQPEFLTLLLVPGFIFRHQPRELLTLGLLLLRWLGLGLRLGLRLRLRLQFWLGLRLWLRF